MKELRGFICENCGNELLEDSIYVVYEMPDGKNLVKLFCNACHVKSEYKAAWDNEVVFCVSLSKFITLFRQRLARCEKCEVEDECNCRTSYLRDGICMYYPDKSIR